MGVSTRLGRDQAWCVVPGWPLPSRAGLLVRPAGRLWRGVQRRKPVHRAGQHQLHKYTRGMWAGARCQRLRRLALQAPALPALHATEGTDAACASLRGEAGRARAWPAPAPQQPG
jgi:hypothetical protein